MQPIRCWCSDCGEWLWNAQTQEYLNVCPRCNSHITVDDVKEEIEWVNSNSNNH